MTLPSIIYFCACGIGKQKQRPNSKWKGHKESEADKKETQDLTENQRTVMTVLHDIILLLGLNGTLYFLTRPVNALSVCIRFFFLFTRK